MRDQSIGINLIGRDVSASKTMDKVSKRAQRVSQGLQVAAAAAGAFALKLGKDSVAAALAEERAMANLNRVLENNGFGAATTAVSKFIDDLEIASGVSDDRLRPAFIQLFSALGSVTKAQRTLQIAMDVSAATGRDLSSVTASIAKAAAGSNTAISRLGLGISKADLAAMSFDEILRTLENKFGGSTATAAETMSGKMDRLKAAIEQAKEAAGIGFLEAFDMLANQGSSDIQVLAEKIVAFGVVVGDVFRGIGATWKSVTDAFDNTMLGKILKNVSGLLQGDGEIPLWLKAVPGSGPLLALLDWLRGKGKDRRQQGAIGTGGSYFSYKAQQTAEANAAKNVAENAKKLAAAEAAAAAKLAAAKAKEAAARREAAAAAAKELRMKKLAAKFDQQLISIAAAKARTKDGGILGRLNALDVLAMDSAGLPVSDKALAAAEKAMNVNVEVNAGSIISEGELIAKISETVQAQTRRTGGGLGRWNPVAL